MKILRVTRKVILDKYIHGVLTVDGTKFSCRTIEAEDPAGQYPVNPIFAYALPLGEYKVRLSTYEYYPLVPTILHKPYINIGLRECPVTGPRPGDIGIGTEFYNDTYLKGFEPVYFALENIIKSDIVDWRRDARLIIEQAEDCERRKTLCGYSEDADFLKLFEL